MQRHWNDFDAAELLLQQKDIHLEHEDNCYFIQQLQQLKKNSQEIIGSVSNNESYSENLQFAEKMN